jgi:hypothetical protein
VAGGILHDVFHGYGRLYIGAWGLGIGAFPITLTFRPFSRSVTDPVNAQPNSAL